MIAGSSWIHRWVLIPSVEVESSMLLLADFVSRSSHCLHFYLKDAKYFLLGRSWSWRKREDILSLWCSVARSCLTLRNPMDCSPPCSSAHGIFQARILEWGVISYSRRPPQPRDQTCICVSCIWQVDSLPLVPPGKPKILSIWILFEPFLIWLPKMDFTVFLPF